MKTNIRTLAKGILLALSLPICAQENIISIRVQGLSMSDTPIEDLFWRQEDSYEPFPAPVNFLPASIEYTGPNPMILYTKSEKPIEGEALYRPVASVQIPEKSGEMIFLCRQDGQGVNVAPILVRNDSFPDGSYLIFNLGTRPILFVMKDSSRTLAPNSAQIEEGPKDRAPIQVILRFADDPENLSLVSTTWFHNPLHRNLVFFQEEGQKLNVRSVTRRPSP